MHRRHQPTNIPTEIVRTLVAIADTGSFSKAGEKLNLSQPAISAQIKRLQVLVGGAIFQKQAGGGTDFTSIGRLALSHARRFLEANDQILAIGGGARNGQPIRLGLSAFYAERFVELLKEHGGPPLYIHCDRSPELTKGLNESHFDVVCGLTHSPRQEASAITWTEEMVWTRRPDFVISPGTPLPLVVWPADFDEQPAVEAVERARVSYRIAFSSADLHARIAAVSAGIGLMVMPKRLLTPQLVVANDYYLPKLEAANGAVRVRPGFEAEGLDALLGLLRRLAPASSPMPAHDANGQVAAHRPDVAQSDKQSKRRTA